MEIGESEFGIPKLLHTTEPLRGLVYGNWVQNVTQVPFVFEAIPLNKKVCNLINDQTLTFFRQGQRKF